jgi:chemotaxis protein histidine kinase CheA
MEKLTQSQRDVLTKMSTDRLRGKLAKAGLEESQISAMSREQLLDACAALTLKEQELAAPVAAAATVPTVGYDVELERRRLEFEMMKFREEKEREEARRKEEREWKERELALQEQRLAREAAEKEEAKREKEELLAREAAEKEEAKREKEELLAREAAEKEEAKREKEELLAREAAEKAERLAREMVEKEEAKREKEELLAREEAEIKRRMEKEAKEAEERIALYKLQEQELHMKQIQWEWQKSQDARERERQQTPAAQIKFFGNVLKNVMPKFPTDVADVPIFFEGVEKLFDSFKVPEELRSKLLLPYLSDRAKSLLLRLEQSKQEKYDEMKLFLLNELKLTPIQFKERFDRAMRNRDETCTMFCSRLKNFLTYYCNSRKVEENFKKLFSLLIADKIKSTLTEACLNHVLTAEGDSWLDCDDLANVVDIYFANHTAEGRPKMTRPEFRNRGHVAENVVRKPNNGNYVSETRANPMAGAVSSMGSPRDVHVQRVSAKHGVKDDFAFLWEHAIFRHPPNKNHLTDRSEILHT